MCHPLRSGLSGVLRMPAGSQVKYEQEAQHAVYRSCLSSVCKPKIWPTPCRCPANLKRVHRDGAGSSRGSGYCVPLQCRAGRAGSPGGPVGAFLECRLRVQLGPFQNHWPLLGGGGDVRCRLIVHIEMSWMGSQLGWQAGRQRRLLASRLAQAVVRLGRNGPVPVHTR